MILKRAAPAQLDQTHGRQDRSRARISSDDLVHGTPVLDVKPYVFAEPTLDAIVQQRRSKFYATAAELRRAIEQMLVLDICSLHQGRGSIAEAQRF
ncbi:hypothetical protein BBJ29_009663 [Phytophthora kernoviae]|uniref:TsaA-like domain-containing protein n=1 Tax=Phytophthora kernoviae TaxID=325452 RepID=A0A3F2S238_9STRA|nr:hypothetical protein BBJ29_009663 [Phytophthora kernoviae]RLN68759.1 hypothetical protein BBP00_00000858 [Phytophthora kernoviae]